MDPQSEHAANALAGLGVGFILFGVLFLFAILAFLVFCLYRIFTKAGMSGWLSLLTFVPFGGIIVLCILAFAEWKVVPVVTGSPYYPPVYPPPPLQQAPPPPAFQPPPQV